MRTVNRFESNLLKIVYCVLGRFSFEKSQLAIEQGIERPKCISRDAVELIKAALSKGITQRLATDHGWMSETFLRNQKPSTGRLWDRSEPKDLGLEFSKHSLDFLIWMTSTELRFKTFWRAPPHGQLSLGDKVLFASVIDALAGTEVGNRWIGRRLFFSNGMAVLMHAHRFTSENIEKTDFVPWVTGLGAAILEGMQGTLARSWIEMEEKKRSIREPSTMLKRGAAQSQAITRFMDAADSAGRRDLCRFLLVAIKKILEKGSELKYWTSSLDMTGLRVAERTEIKEGAAAVLLQANRLQKWNQESFTSGYLDENYNAMQLWKSDWERLEMQASIDKAIRIGREVSF